MKYVTIKMICAHTGKHRATVLRALKNLKLKPDRLPGMLGLRVKLADANRMIALYWPDKGPMGWARVEEEAAV